MKKLLSLTVVVLLLVGCMMGVSAMWRQDAVIAGSNEKTEEALTWPSLFLEKTKMVPDAFGDEYEHGCTGRYDSMIKVWLNGKEMTLEDFVYNINDDYVALQLTTGDVVRVDFSGSDDWYGEVLMGGRTWDSTQGEAGDTSFSVTFTVVDSVYITAYNTTL